MGSVLQILAQSSGGSASFTERIGSIASSAGTDTWVWTMIFWATCIFLLLVLHAMIAVWIYKDAKITNRPAGRWAILGAVPLLGVIAMIVYTLGERPQPAGLCNKHQQPFIPGREGEECIICFQERMSQEHQRAIEEIRNQQRELSAKVKAESAQESVPSPSPPVQTPQGPSPVPSASADADVGSTRRDTAPLAVRPSTVISLQQIGGQRHGMTTSLTLKNIMGQPIRNIVGRDASCKLAIPDDENVSSQHCSIGEAEDGSYYVADLDSLNGTFLIRNGEERQVFGRETIMDGDILRLGSTELRVIITEPPKREGL